MAITFDTPGIVIRRGRTVHSARSRSSSIAASDVSREVSPTI